MSQDFTGLDLDGLLGLSMRAVEQNAAQVVSAWFGTRREIVLFGAGQLGRQVLQRLRSAGIEPRAFVDETPGKAGSVVEGLSVLTPADAADRFGRDATFVVTINNAAHRFMQTRSRLGSIPQLHVAPFLALAWRHPNLFLPYFQFTPPAELLAHADDVRRACELMADAASRAEFIAHIRFRLSLDFAALPPNSPVKYFHHDLLPPPHSNDVCVDCGAYDGDTLREFLQQCGNDFGRYIALEPDPANFARLQAFVSTLNDATRARTQLINVAVGADRQTARFDASGGEGSRLDPAGAGLSEVQPLDEILADVVPTLIKFDVEGAEQDALRGATRVMRAHRPALAVSAYHRPDDLWRIPLDLDSLGVGYRFHLRTEGEDGFGSVCYAVAGSDSPA